MSESGTKRTSPAGLTKSVVRVNRKWLADRQTDAFDRRQSSLGPGRKARSGWKADISLAAHRVDWLKAAKDEALGVERNFTRNLQTQLCIRRQLRCLILQALARRADIDPP
jgi:hypothetical protein